MSFRLLHTAIFAAIPLLGIVALQTAAAIPQPVALLGLALIVAALATPETLRARVPAAVTGAVPILLAALAAGAVARGVESVLAAVVFSVALQILRIATRQGATHDPQIVILAILHIVSAAVLGGTIGFGVTLLAFVFVAPAALTLSHLRREVERNYEAGAKDRAGRRVDVERILRSKRVAEPKWVLRSTLIAPFVLAFTAVLFLVVPRVGLAVFLLKPPESARMIGFSDAVDLGSMGELQGNDALAARVEWEPPRGQTPPPLLPFYLRGTAFDRYDGHSWKKTDASAGAALDIRQNVVDVPLGPTTKETTTLTVRLEPLEPTVLFVPTGARALRFEPTGETRSELLVHSGPEGEWRYEAKEPVALRYGARVSLDARNVVGTLPPTEAPRYLQLPATLDPRVRALAREVVGDAASTSSKVARLVAHLRERYRYSVSAPSGGKEDPLAHFLFETRAGHCEFFSTALAVLLRAEGVPTRNVTGFAGAQRNDFGRYYSVRQQNAHAWVEYWQPLGENAGRWELADATPVTAVAPKRSSRLRLQELYEAIAARWDRHVAAFDLKDQADMAARLARPFADAETAMRRVGSKKLLLAAASLLTALVALAFAYARRAAKNAAQGHDGLPRPETQRSAQAIVRALESTLGPRGSRASHETLREYVARVCPPPAADPAHALVSLYEGARWGNASLHETRVREAIQALRDALAASLSSRPMP